MQTQILVVANHNLATLTCWHRKLRGFVTAHLERIFSAGPPVPKLPRLSMARAAWPPDDVFIARGSPLRPPWRRRRRNVGGGRDSLGAVVPPPFCLSPFGVCVDGGVGSASYSSGGVGRDGRQRTAPGAARCEAMSPRPRSVAVGWYPPGWPRRTANASGVCVGGASGSPWT